MVRIRGVRSPFNAQYFLMSSMNKLEITIYENVLSYINISSKIKHIKCKKKSKNSLYRTLVKKTNWTNLS